MDAKEFRVKGKEAVDYIADYLENISKRRVTPDVEPGYLRDLLPKEAPVKGENWDDIFSDFETKIMPGVTHWQHPRFHAYFPAGNCYPSIIGELLSAGLGTVNFSWAASPSCTELETIVLDWLGKMINLPGVFLPFFHKKEIIPASSPSETNNNGIVNGNGNGEINGHSSHNGKSESDQDDACFDDPPSSGGGVILGSASECVLVSLLSARTDILRKLKAKHPFVEDGVLLSKLVMYTSKLAHSCVEKAGVIAMVKIRLLNTDENYSLRGSELEKAVKDDRSNGLIPFFVSATFGTTSCCSFDNVKEIGQYCHKEEIYLHVDGAYAGSALICEEFRGYLEGLELVDSFNFNPNKWMLINFDCSCLWVKDKFMLTKALSVDPIYLRYKEMDKAIDYRHWGIALSRRFRALKIWFTLRSYGVEGLQHYIREHVRLAKIFEQLILSDSRFEILAKVTMGLVCFRLKGPNSLSQNLLFLLNDSGKIHMVPAMLDDKYVIRFCVNAKIATNDDMFTAWEQIRTNADIVLKQDELENSTNSEQIGLITSELKRLRFGISKMVSDPRISYNQKKFSTKRSPTTFKFTSDSSKYLARKCSIVENDDE